MSRGPGNNQLLGTYEHTETFAYQDEIGEVLLSICKVTASSGLSIYLYYYISRSVAIWSLIGQLLDTRYSNRPLGVEQQCLAAAQPVF